MKIAGLLKQKKNKGKNMIMTRLVLSLHRASTDTLIVSPCDSYRTGSLGLLCGMVDYLAILLCMNVFKSSMQIVLSTSFVHAYVSVILHILVL